MSLTYVHFISEIHDYILFWKLSFNTRNLEDSKHCSLLFSRKNPWSSPLVGIKEPLLSGLYPVLFQVHSYGPLSLFSHLPPWQALNQPVPSEGKREEYSDSSVSSAYNSYEKNKWTCLLLVLVTHQTTSPLCYTNSNCQRSPPRKQVERKDLTCHSATLYCLPFPIKKACC